MSTQRPGEDNLIARFFAPLAAEGGLGLKDDTACLSPTPGHDLVLTTDALVETDAGTVRIPLDLIERARLVPKIDWRK